MADTSLSVGIVCHTIVQQHHLRHLVEEFGYNARHTFLVEQAVGDINALRESTATTDLWLVDIDLSSLDQSRGLMAFESWLYNLKQPVIFGEGTTYNANDKGFDSWLRQLHNKIFNVAGDILHKDKPASELRAVWVLAASIGGPEAIKEFLDNVKTGLGIGFIYAQHLEARQHHALAGTIGRNSEYDTVMAEHGEFIQADQVIMVPASQQVSFTANGMVMFHDERWRGAYTPSMDQVVANIADSFKHLSGAIFFSGMGEDGVAGARLMHRQQGKIWIQKAATCTSDVTPNAIKQTGCVSKIGTPRELANLLNKLYSQSKEFTPG